MGEPGSKPDGKAALREEIDRLTSGKPTDEQKKNTGQPANPRDFIHRRMAELDQKPKE